MSELEIAEENEKNARLAVADNARHAKFLVERDAARRSAVNAYNRDYRKKVKAELAEARALLGLPAPRRGRPQKEPLLIALPESGGAK